MSDEPNTPDQNPRLPEPALPEVPSQQPFAAPEVRPSIDLRDTDWLIWTGWDVVLLVLMTIVSMFLFTAIGIGVAMHMRLFQGMKMLDIAGEPRFIVPVQIVAYVAVFCCMVLIVRRTRGATFWKAIQWKWPGVSAFGYLLGGIVLAIAIQLLSVLLPIPKQLPIEKYFKDTFGAYLMAVFGITIAPLLEELFFRGFLYPVLARRIGMIWGVITTSILFAFIHESQLGRAWAPVLLLFIVGVALTYVRARTGSVARAFLLHVAYNSVLFFVLWAQSDHFHHLEKALSMFVFKP